MSDRERAVLFDLDGTLVWLDVDIEAVREELARMFEPLGYAGGFQPVLAGIDRAAGAVGGDRETWRARGRAVLADAELEAAARARACEGAVDAVAAARAAGWRIGVVTNNSGRCVAPALRAAGIDVELACCVSRDDVAAPKPDPEGVIAAARALLPDGGVLDFVGDSPQDVAAGIAARPVLSNIELRIIAVRGGRGAVDDAGADEVIEHLGTR